MQINLNDFTVLNADGSVDQDGMLVKLSEVVKEFATSRDGTNSALEKQLDAIFDASDKPAIQTVNLALKVVMARGGDIDKDLAAVKKELKLFVEAHPRFDTGAGRTGGIRRLSLKNAENAREHGLEHEAPAAEAAPEAPEATESETTDEPVEVAAE